MKLNKIALAALLSLTAVSTVQAAGSSGTITFFGTIDSAPCSIKPGEDGDNQNIPMGGISDVALAAGGFSPPKDVKIELIGCTLGTLTQATTTFTGAETTLSEYAGSYGLYGTASGAALHIRQTDGTVIKIGVASDPQTLLEGDNTLRFEAILQGAADNTANPIVPGNFNVPVNFTITYS